MVANIWSKNLETLALGLDLIPEDVQWCMREILEGRAETERIKEFLLALKAKGETSEEVGALVAQMYEHCAPINISVRAVDTVGTG
ncbi:MAG: anthranilate phosphoribosyltransferase, partial [Actinobacteria bacterium]|nr:anthranilate phosphoribosyltransferase [Actinomycetota bacterium]